jgi:hypothetical protein
MSTMVQSDEKLQELTHQRDAMEKVAREMLTAVQPETTHSAVAALLDLLEAERNLNAELIARLSS